MSGTDVSTSGDERSRGIALVVQRYGSDLTGGAEAHAAALVKRLAVMRPVTVLTTCARGYRTWANEYPSGRSLEEAGVEVLRFPVARTRSPVFFAAGSRVLLPLFRCAGRQGAAASSRLLACLQDWWIRSQGPYSPELVDFIREHSAKFSHVIFFTYLYYPTVEGSRVARCPKILVPTAHDEAPFHMPLVGEVLRRFDRIIVNTPPERALVVRRDHSLESRVVVAGIGVDLPAQDTQRRGCSSLTPYALYLGRVGRAKNVQTLLRAFEGDPPRDSSGTPLRLVLAGHHDRDLKIPSRPWIEWRGFVDSSERDKLIREATCLVQPSQFESLSLVVLEALTHGRPVIANGECQVFRWYASQVGAVRLYDTAAGLRHELDQVLKAPPPPEVLDASTQWVRETFSWTKVLSVYETVLKETEAHGA